MNERQGHQFTPAPNGTCELVPQATRGPLNACRHFPQIHGAGTDDLLFVMSQLRSDEHATRDDEGFFSGASFTSSPQPS
jgi:hypothetical protein